MAEFSAASCSPRDASGEAEDISMAGIWTQVALVFGLALIASLLAHRYRLSTALVEIIVGMVAGSTLATFGGYGAFAVQEPWVKALAGIGAIFLTFLAGAELDPDVFKLKWKEAASIGAASFFVPSVGCWAAAHVTAAKTANIHARSLRSERIIS